VHITLVIFFDQVGGPSVIAEAMVPIIERFGGKALVRAPVSSIIVENGVAVGVICKGKEIYAPIVVSAIGAPKTFNQLIPESERECFQEEIDFVSSSNVKSKCSLSSVFVGLKGAQSELKLPKGNYWIFPSWNHAKNMALFEKDPLHIPGVFISFSSAKDPTYDERCPGKSVALVIAPSLYEEVEAYANERVHKRGQEYEQKKSALKDKLMEIFCKEFPALKDKIEFIDVGTAVTNDYYLGTFRGAVYGLGHTPTRFSSDFTSPKTKIKNLYLTGQDVALCGIAGALMGGVLTASQISIKSVIRIVFG
jgi:phytoene dehydrogenase-like protein